MPHQETLTPEDLILNVYLTGMFMLMAVTKLIVLFIPFTTVSIINLYFLVENRFRRFHSPSLDMFKTSGCLDGTVKKNFQGVRLWLSNDLQSSLLLEIL